MTQRSPAPDDADNFGPTGDYLGIDVAPDTTCCRVRLIGELDLATLPKLNAVLDHVCRDGFACIEVDLIGLSFLSVSALNAFATRRAALSESGRHLVLANPSPLVRRVLELTKLYDALVTVP